MSHVPNDPDLRAIESALGGLIPAASRLDRDRLMFEAGALARPAGSARRWVWPALAAVLALVVVGESLLLARRPAPRVVERLVVVREPAPAPAPTEPAPVVLLSPATDSAPTVASSSWVPPDYRRLEDLVLRFGLDAFPEPARRLSEPGALPELLEPNSASAGALRRIELEKLLNPGDRS
jgi:hypothetical protein